MHDLNAIVERLRAIFRDSFHVDVPSPETDLLESGIVDSLQFVDLLVKLENEFGARLAIETLELDDLKTLSRLAALLASQAPSAPTALHPAANESPQPAKLRKLSVAG